MTRLETPLAEIALAAGIIATYHFNADGVAELIDCRIRAAGQG